MTISITRHHNGNARMNDRLKIRRPLVRIALWGVAAVAVLPALFVALFGVVPVPLTPLMVLRALDGAPVAKTWMPLANMSPRLPALVIAAEDNLFCRHDGFDLDALAQAWRANQRSDQLRGASTISQQTAKNVFLWPGRSYVRKALEAWLTLYIETLWSKRRIIEVYLNVAEWGDGIYGAEAAARRYFKGSAASLGPGEAAHLAAMIPNPRYYERHRSARGLQKRQGTIAARMGQVAVPR